VPAVRGPARTACLTFALGALICGCGSSGTVQGGNDTFSATTLTVYSDLPLLGPNGPQMTSIVNGEILALYNHGGHVGKLHVSLESLNDYPDASVSDPLLPDPLRSAQAQIGQSAHTASSDLSTVAYIGDYDSAATAISLPLNNQNDILQVSPGSPYIGFTNANPADLSGDPGVFDPYGTPTFARLVPSDLVEAMATVSWMRALGVKRIALLADNSNAPENYNAVIASEVARDAPAAAITVVGSHAGLDTASLTRPGDYARLAAELAAEHPGAILLGGTADAGAQALWQELHLVLPAVKLFAPSTLATPAFLRGLGAAANATYVTSPILELGQYPPSAQKVFAQYRRTFAVAPTAYTLYGYDAMSDILAAIKKAKRYAAKRSALLSAFFHLGEIKGTIGDYEINADGDTSLARFDGYRVTPAGRLVLVRAIS
jgi:branched-chain amino acid transport system substrate-binding protein